MENSLAELAALLDGRVDGDPDAKVAGGAPFENAQAHEITFAGSVKYLKKIGETGAGAVVVPDQPGVGRKELGTEKHLVLVANPQLAFVTLLNHFLPGGKPEDAIHPAAVIGADVAMGTDIAIGPCAVLGDGVRLGDRVSIEASAVIGANVTIGDDVVIRPNVTIMDGCSIGSRVLIHSGTVIGSDGFGFAPDGTRYHKIPHLGSVSIGDDVEIGANNTIDRGTFGETRIGCGVKTDNLVHIAHNVTVGDNSIIVGQSGIAGSTKLGKNVILAGKAGVAGHLTIGDNVTVGPGGGVTKSLESGQVVSGRPEMPHRLWLKVSRIIPRLPEMKKKLAQLEKRLGELEER